ncbi:MAG: RelA/SpoT family protein [Pseudomonadota bacterium]
MQFDSPDFGAMTLEQVQSHFAADPGGSLGCATAEAHAALRLSRDGGDCRPSGLAVLWLLRQLQVDEATATASALSDPRLRDGFDRQKVASQYGETVSELVASVHWLNTFHDPTGHREPAPEQSERLRRLLVQAVSDVRAILIKLAFRVERLRGIGREPESVQRVIADETMLLYAPLANRLGVGQLKWELEDLSFRYLEPDTYKRIARNLEERRSEREAYLREFVDEVTAVLREGGVEHADVAGRPKHIYSIAKKMRQKSLNFEQLFDVRAVRIIVDTLPQCYLVLGLLHNRWRNIQSEFDDYIAQPKANGYQSLHTVLVGRENKAVEVQIRTRAMHQLAESGVAAHWRYKEQHPGEQSLDRSINALRKLLEQGEEDEPLLEAFREAGHSGRVYVFTPDGDVVDLVAGATPVDFAYAIHTAVGHRCRGAKVNGRIVPLGYQLKDADRVEIITGKEASPTLEWLNPRSGYLASPHARAKVRNWFNRQNREQHLATGRGLFERELNRLNGRIVSDAAYARHFGLDDVEEMWVRLGRGQITQTQLIHAIQQLCEPKTGGAGPVVTEASLAGQGEEVRVLGVGNLMTHRAACCKPIAGDPVVGFITRGRGVSIHRSDCKNIRHLRPEETARLIPVEWAEGDEGRRGQVDLYLEAYDREGLLRDVSAVLSQAKAHLNGLQTRSDRSESMAVMELSLELRDTALLSQLIDQLQQVPNMLEVRRVSS